MNRTNLHTPWQVTGCSIEVRNSDYATILIYQGHSMVVACKHATIYGKQWKQAAAYSASHLSAMIETRTIINSLLKGQATNGN